VDDVAGTDDRLRVESGPGAQADVTARGAGGGADGAVQERRPQSVEEAPIQARTLQFTHCPGVTVGQDCLRSLRGGGDFLETSRDGLQSRIPADTRELTLSLGATAFHRPPEAFGVVDAVEITRNLLAQEALRKGMLAVAAQLHGLAVLDRDHHSAG